MLSWRIVRSETGLIDHQMYWCGGQKDKKEDEVRGLHLLHTLLGFLLSGQGGGGREILFWLPMEVSNQDRIPSVALTCNWSSLAILKIQMTALVYSPLFDLTQKLCHQFGKGEIKVRLLGILSLKDERSGKLFAVRWIENGKSVCVCFN